MDITILRRIQPRKVRTCSKRFSIYLFATRMLICPSIIYCLVPLAVILMEIILLKNLISFINPNCLDCHITESGKIMMVPLGKSIGFEDDIATPLTKLMNVSNCIFIGFHSILQMIYFLTHSSWLKGLQILLAPRMTIKFTLVHLNVFRHGFSRDSFSNNIFTKLANVQVKARYSMHTYDQWKAVAWFLFTNIKYHEVMVEFMRVIINDHLSISF